MSQRSILQNRDDRWLFLFCFKMKVDQLYEWIRSGTEHQFYISPEWQRLRMDVLQDDHGECQRCKARGYYRKANTVHHVNHLKNRPDLALSKYYTEADGTSKRNLISLCHDCHEREHGYRRAQDKNPLTEERW